MSSGENRSTLSWPRLLRNLWITAALWGIIVITIGVLDVLYLRSVARRSPTSLNLASRRRVAEENHKRTIRGTLYRHLHPSRSAVGVAIELMAVVFGIGQWVLYTDMTYDTKWETATLTLTILFSGFFAARYALRLAMTEPGRRFAWALHIDRICDVWATVSSLAPVLNYVGSFWTFGYLRTVNVYYALDALEPWLEPTFQVRRVQRFVIRIILLVFMFESIMAATVATVEAAGDPDNWASVVSPTGGFTSVNALYWAVVTSTTVGYGDVTPKTLLGRLFTILFIIAGIVLIGFFTSKLLELVAGQRHGRGAFYNPARKASIVIVGEADGEALINVLHELFHPEHAGARASLQAVVMTEAGQFDADVSNYINSHPLFNNVVTYIRGTVFDGGDVKRAGADRSECQAALVVQRMFANDDTRNLLRVLALRRRLPRLPVYIMLGNSDNIPFLRAAGISDDMILPMDSIRMGMIAANVLTPGVVPLLVNMFSVDIGVTEADILRKREEDHRIHATKERIKAAASARRGGDQQEKEGATGEQHGAPVPPAPQFGPGQASAQTPPTGMPPTPPYGASAESPLPADQTRARNMARLLLASLARRAEREHRAAQAQSADHLGHGAGPGTTGAPAGQATAERSMAEPSETPARAPAPRGAGRAAEGHDRPSARPGPHAWPGHPAWPSFGPPQPYDHPRDWRFEYGMGLGQEVYEVRCPSWLLGRDLVDATLAVYCSRVIRDTAEVTVGVEPEDDQDEDQSSTRGWRWPWSKRQQKPRRATLVRTEDLTPAVALEHQQNAIEALAERLSKQEEEGPVLIGVRHVKRRTGTVIMRMHLSTRHVLKQGDSLFIIAKDLRVLGKDIQAAGRRLLRDVPGTIASRNVLQAGIQAGMEVFLPKHQKVSSTGAAAGEVTGEHEAETIERKLSVLGASGYELATTIPQPEAEGLPSGPPSRSGSVASSTFAPVGMGSAVPGFGAQQVTAVPAMSAAPVDVTAATVSLPAVQGMGQPSVAAQGQQGPFLVTPAAPPPSTFPQQYAPQRQDQAPAGAATGQASDEGAQQWDRRGQPMPTSEPRPQVSVDTGRPPPIAAPDSGRSSTRTDDRGGPGPCPPSSLGPPHGLTEHIVVITGTAKEGLKGLHHFLHVLRRVSDRPIVVVNGASEDEWRELLEDLQERQCYAPSMPTTRGQQPFSMDNGQLTGPPTTLETPDHGAGPGRLSEGGRSMPVPPLPLPLDAVRDYSDDKPRYRHAPLYFVSGSPLKGAILVRARVVHAHRCVIVGGAAQPMSLMTSLAPGASLSEAAIAGAGAATGTEKATADVVAVDAVSVLTTLIVENSLAIAAPHLIFGTTTEITRDGSIALLGPAWELTAGLQKRTHANERRAPQVMVTPRPPGIHRARTMRWPGLSGLATVAVTPVETPRFERGESMRMPPRHREPQVLTAAGEVIPLVESVAPETLSPPQGFGPPPVPAPAPAPDYTGHGRGWALASSRASAASSEESEFGVSPVPETRRVEDELSDRRTPSGNHGRMSSARRPLLSGPTQPQASHARGPGSILPSHGREPSNHHPDATPYCPMGTPFGEASGLDRSGLDEDTTEQGEFQQAWEDKQDRVEFAAERGAGPMAIHADVARDVTAGMGVSFKWSPRFAAGRLVPVSSVYSLLVQAFYNPSLLRVVRILTRGEHVRIRHLDVPPELLHRADCASHPRHGGTAGATAAASATQDGPGIGHGHNNSGDASKGHRCACTIPYARLFLHLVLHKRVVPLGLYRDRLWSHAALPYVHTNPAMHSSVRYGDKAFIAQEVDGE